jgi:lipid II:glycine glycyltransferase (peptidoglycan interpeptide bridge formation enzyme)
MDSDLASVQDLTPPRFTHCIFQEDWWLEAVAPGAWQAIVVGNGREIQARLPYVHTRGLLFSTIRHPKLTHFMGPWYRPTGGKRTSALGREKELANELFAQLPSCDFFSMNFHPDITNWLPYYWMGFEPVPRVAYMLDRIGTEAELWEGLQPNIRREIKKAEKRLEVVRSDDVDLLVELTRKTFDRQHMQLPYSPQTLHRVNTACVARNARQIYFARDEQQRVHAAMYTVFDDRCAHYLLGGADAALRNSGASSLLVWNALLDAAKTSAGFNFSGSIHEDIEHFLRAFGGQQKTYMNVRRGNLKALAALKVRDAFRSLRGRR